MTDEAGNKSNDNAVYMLLLGAYMNKSITTLDRSDNLLAERYFLNIKSLVSLLSGSIIDEELAKTWMEKLDVIINLIDSNTLKALDMAKDLWIDMEATFLQMLSSEAEELAQEVDRIP